MRSKKAILQAAVLRGGTLFAWGALLLYFSFAGQLSVFLAPSFRPLIPVTGFVLLGLGVAILCSGRAGVCSEPGCDHRGEGVTLAGWIATVGLLGLLTATVWAAPSGFSAETVLRRMPGSGERAVAPIGLRGLPAELAEEENEWRLEPEMDEEVDLGQYFNRDAGGLIEAEITDLWAATADPVFRRFLEKERVTVVGQFLQSRGSKPAQEESFKLVRLMVNCCAADAQPVSVPVRVTKLPEMNEMDWIRVEGQFSIRLEAGENVPTIEAHIVEKTNPPEEIYIFY